MGFLSAYKENVRVTYVSEVFSRATFFNFIILILAITCPYLIAYRTQGFWNKLDLVREQPIVEFKYEALFILDLQNDAVASTKTLVWSTLTTLNRMLDSDVVASISSRQGDENMDGIYEYLDLQVTIPIGQDFHVSSFHIFLLFDYKLVKHTTLRMESLAYTNFQQNGKRNRFNLLGDLNLIYKSPLWNHVRDERYTKAVISRNSTQIRDYDIFKILREYSSRHVSTILKNKYEFAEHDNQNQIQPDAFQFNIHINYVEVSYERWAGIWNTLKWAWIQYLAVFVVVFAVMKRFQRMAYEANMFEIRREVPWEMKNGTRNVISHNQKN